MKKAKIEEFENEINYIFKNKDLINLAFTHSSYANETNKSKLNCNERLEFLGDAALDLVVSKYIYENFPEMPEGELTKLRAGVVCEGSLAKKARYINLGNFLLLGHGEETTGGRNRDSVLADAFEAVVGAIYLDGGMEELEKYILRLMENEIEEMRDMFKTIDCKTRLQEVIQKYSKNSLAYKIISEAGPDHDKVFEAQVCHENRILGNGKGKSKKEAEQAAAADALENLPKYYK